MVSGGLVTAPLMCVGVVYSLTSVNTPGGGGV